MASTNSSSIMGPASCLHLSVFGIISLLLCVSALQETLAFQSNNAPHSWKARPFLDRHRALYAKESEDDEQLSKTVSKHADEKHQEARPKSIIDNEHGNEEKDPPEIDELIFIPEDMAMDDATNNLGESSDLTTNGTNTIDFFPINADPRAFFKDDHLEKRQQDADLESVLEITLPFVLPVGGYVFYDKGAALFNSILGSLSPRNWVPADGGTYRAQLITPLMNGIVLPAIALLFATLTSTTIGTLRLRQIEIRQCINDEAGELRALSYLIASLPSETQDLCRKYLTQYTSRIIAESQPEFVDSLDDNLSSSTISMTDSELHGVIQLLTKTVSEDKENISPLLVDQCFQSVARLRMSRQRRLTALESSYPPEHFALLGTLVFAELTGFLIEADQQVLIFLNAVELRILWSMLIGTFAALSALLFDLLNPFSGIYRVTPAVDQLYIIRLGFQAETKMSLLGIDLKGGDDDDKDTRTSMDSWTDI